MLSFEATNRRSDSEHDVLNNVTSSFGVKPSQSCPPVRDWTVEMDKPRPSFVVVCLCPLKQTRRSRVAFVVSVRAHGRILHRILTKGD